MQKTILLFSLIIILISCINNTSNKNNDISNKDTVKRGNLSPQDSLYTPFNIKPFIGEWFCIKYEKGFMHSDTNFVREYINKDMLINENSFFDVNSKCEFITYHLSLEKDYSLYRNDFMKKYNLMDRNIQLIETMDSNKYNCSLFYVISKDTLIGLWNGIYFFYKKRPSLHKANSDNDTVRCKEGTRCAETGFVLKGSRKNGKAIHVKPKNTNVPMED